MRRVVMLLCVAGALVVSGCSSPLHDAVRRTDIKTVTALLDKGADVNEKVIGNSSTALIAASTEGAIDIVRLLLDRGADVDLAVGNRYTPLTYAAWKGETDVARLLIERGADIDRAKGGLRDMGSLLISDEERRRATALLAGLKKSLATPAAMQVHAEQQEAQAKAKLEANLNSYKGMLKTATLLSIAGEPAEKLAVTDGEVWIYRYGEAGTGGRFTVTLQIGKDGIVTDWRHNNGPVFVNTANGLQLLDIPFLK